MTQFTTSNNNAALGYSPQNKIAYLYDGTMLTGSASTTALTLWQISSPGSSPTFAALTQTFAIGTSQLNFDILVVDNGNSTNDVWVAYASDSSTQYIHVAHATYSASGWTWDNTGYNIGLQTNYCIPSLAWTGTYLIAGWRSSAYAFVSAYTTTQNGSAGWSAVQQLSTKSASGSSHFFGSLHHDTTLGATIVVYSQASAGVGTESLLYRLLPDTASPLLANWFTAGTIIGSNLNVGAANIVSALDHATGQLHVAWCDATASTANSPGYINSSSITVSSGVIAWNSAVSLDTSTAVTAPAIGFDGKGTVHVLWATAAVGSNSTLSHLTIPSPFTTPSSTTSLGTASNDNNYPKIPFRSRFNNGYVPLVYEYSATSPYALQFDTSLSALSGGSIDSLLATVSTQNSCSARIAIAHHPAGTVSTGGALTAALTHGKHLAATVTSGGAASATVSLGAIAVALAATVASQDACSGALTLSNGLSGTVTSDADCLGDILDIPTIPNAGTLIATLAVTTQSQTWSNGPSGSPGTETDITSTDVNGDGWAVGSIPTYGGMPISSVYEVDTNVAGANQTTLATTVPDGHIHWLVNSTHFVGSEDPKFTLSELAPVGTSFRRYYTTTSTANDTNGLGWVASVCIYPGDPALIAYAFTYTNNKGSALTLNGTSDQIEVAVIGGLQQVDNTWAPANGGYGIVGGANTTGWPYNSVNVEPDYFYITPTVGSSMKIGQMTVKLDAVSTAGWSSPSLQYLQGGGRLKLKIMGNKGGHIAIGESNTLHFIQVLRRGMTVADVKTIAADSLNPGTPTATTGTFTSFVKEERAYQFAASSNTLNTTLDLSSVTIRYKPIIKVTNWTNAYPNISFGGSLTAGTDYQYTYDSANSILYVQLYFDIVPSGATGTQRNNSALNIQSGSFNDALVSTVSSGSASTARLTVAHHLSATTSSGASCSATMTVTGNTFDYLSATVSSGSASTGNIIAGHALSGTISSGCDATGILTAVIPSTGAYLWLLT